MFVLLYKIMSAQNVLFVAFWKNIFLFTYHWLLIDILLYKNVTFYTVVCNF